MNKYLILTTCLLILPLTASNCGPKQQPILTSTPISIQMPKATDYESTPVPDEALPIPPTASTGQIPIIFDDDGSPDGTTALLYLLSHPQVDLKAVNISYGEAHPEIYIQHIGRMLDAFGIVDIPLGYGQDAPMEGTNEFPEGVRQAANNFWGLPIPNADKTYPVQTAPELMISIIHQSPSPVTIFVSGPATNLAQALRLDPEAKKNISAVYLMGGAVYVPGNISDFYPDHVNKVAEWNIFADPQAAKEVFKAGIDLYLVPLDATNQVLITRQDTGQWRQGGEIADFAADIYDMLLNNWGIENAAIWDLMTAAIMLKPDLCRFQPLHLQVITEAGDTSGQTAAIPGKKVNSSVCLEPDADMIRQILIDVFSGSIKVPTPFPNLTETLEPTPTVTPVSQIFRDDFTVNIQSGWIWQNEDPSRWAITSDGWLQIVGEDTSLLADGTQTNLLCRNAPEGDFQITVHLSANPIVDFQQATLYLYQDGDTYIAMNRGYCGPCGTGGSGLFMEYKYPGGLGTYEVKTQGTDITFRLVRQEQTITGYYTFETWEWQRFGRVGNYLEMPKVCLGVSNVDYAGTNDKDLVGQFDYIEISRP
jgi:pyrimidine-specific ribonucleoside hydrolase